MCTKIIVAREKEECIARQRSPITREIYSALLDQAKKSLVDSAESVVFDWFTLIRITGLRCAEYAQKTQTNIDEHEYASGKRVIKAFVPSDWKFYNSKGRLIIDLMEVPAKLKMTFRIQKNRQNGQSIMLVAAKKLSELALFIYRLYLICIHRIVWYRFFRWPTLWRMISLTSSSSSISSARPLIL